MTKKEKIEAQRIAALTAHLSATEGLLDAESVSRSYGIEIGKLTSILRNAGRLNDAIRDHGRLSEPGSATSQRSAGEGQSGSYNATGGRTGPNHLPQSSQPRTQAQGALKGSGAASAPVKRIGLWVCPCSCQTETDGVPDKCWGCGGEMSYWRDVVVRAKV